MVLISFLSGGQKMPAVKLTMSVVARLRAPDPSGKQRLVWDSELKGFGVLISGATTVRTYIAQRTLPNGRTRRVTVGSVAELDVDAARAQAAEFIHHMRQGIDPKAVQRSAAAWTLRHTLDEYLAARKDLKPKSARVYRHWIEQHLAAWLDRPLRSITSDEVEERHRSAARSPSGTDSLSISARKTAAVPPTRRCGY